MSKPIKHSDIVNAIVSSRKYNRAKNARIVSKLAREYFKMVTENVINGYAYDFTGTYFTNTTLGTIHVSKRKHTINTLNNSWRYGFNQPYNEHTVGYYYTIDFDSDMLKKVGMKFYPAVTFRKKLAEALRTGNYDYRLAE